MAPLPFWIGLSAVGASPEARTIDVGADGLMEATKVLAARTSVPIDYEGVPRDVEGVHYSRATKPGDRNQYLVDGPFVFAYPAGATASQALEAAVRTNNAAPDAYVWFHVVADGPALILVPDHVKNAAGEWVAYRPLLDQALTLSSNVGTAQTLYEDLVGKLSEAIGSPVRDSRAQSTMDTCRPWATPDGCPVVVLPSATGTARSLLDQILAQAGGASEWRLTHVMPGVPGASGWNLSWDLIRKTDDNDLEHPYLPPNPSLPLFGE